MKDIGSDRRVAFEALMDDSTEAVRKALLREFRSLGDVAVVFLRELTESSNFSLANSARGYLNELLGEETIKDFHEFIESHSYDLEHGLYLLARTIYPMLKAEDMTQMLDDIGERCRSLMRHPSSEREQCNVINGVLFEEMGFYCSPRDTQISCSNLLSDLLGNHRGSSISLAMLYILVARRCSLALHPVIEEGKCYVGCFTVHEPFYLDVTQKGRFLSVSEITPDNECSSPEAETKNPQPSVVRRILMPASVGDVLYFHCRVLQRQYKRQSNHVIVNMFERFIRCFEKAYERHNG